MSRKAATREPPKRTRRVTAPFDDRLEVRCYKAEKRKLQAEAEKRGLTIGDLVRFQLGDLMAVDPAEAAPTPPEPDEAPQEAAEDLPAVLVERFGLSRGQAVLKIALGKVQVNGELWPHDEIPVDLIDHVTVDGEAASALAT